MTTFKQFINAENVNLSQDAMDAIHKRLIKMFGAEDAWVYTLKNTGDDRVVLRMGVEFPADSEETLVHVLSDEAITKLIVKTAEPFVKDYSIVPAAPLKRNRDLQNPAEIHADLLSYLVPKHTA